MELSAQDGRNPRLLRSRGGDVASSLGNAMVIDLEHPGRALLEPALACPDHLATDEVFDQLPEDVAVRAEHEPIERSIAQEFDQALQAVTLFQRGRRLDLFPPCAGERFDGLHAA